jgi:site-specific DNA-methyltransferase (adenine-specific)
MELKDLVKESYYYDKTGMLLFGDCLEWMPKIPDKSIDMILADLPYGTTSNKWDVIIPFELLWKEYNRICKNNAVIALMGSQPFTSLIATSNLTMYKHEWIWIKNRGSNFANTVREPFKEHESILIFSKGNWTYNKQMQERTGSGLNRVQYNIKYESKSENYRNFNSRLQNKPPTLRVPSSWQKFNTETGLHPTQKPVGLFEYFIKTYTDEDMIILDNAAGSCTTAIAAKNTNRKWICIEKEEKYCEISKKRIENWQKEQIKD